MTDEQINQCIAEACGLKKPSRKVKLNDKGFFVTQHAKLPNYCSDLNAMHEAERVLKGYNQIHTYVWHLSNRNDWETDFKMMEVHISARDRAEAFLRTLGKWEEAQK